MLAGYQRLAALRRELPELTEPRFGSAFADEDRRRLTLVRRTLAVHVNLGATPWRVPAAEVLFSTVEDDGTGPVDGEVEVAPGNGVLVRTLEP